MCRQAKHCIPHKTSWKWSQECQSTRSRVETARPPSRTKILQIGTADDLEGQVEVLSIHRDLQSIRNDVDKPVVTSDIVRRVTGKPENRPTHLWAIGGGQQWM